MAGQTAWRPKKAVNKRTHSEFYPLSASLPTQTDVNICAKTLALERAKLPTGCKKQASPHKGAHHTPQMQTRKVNAQNSHGSQPQAARAQHISSKDPGQGVSPRPEETTHTPESRWQCGTHRRTQTRTTARTSSKRSARSRRVQCHQCKAHSTKTTPLLHNTLSRHSLRHPRYTQQALQHSPRSSTAQHQHRDPRDRVTSLDHSPCTPQAAAPVGYSTTQPVSPSVIASDNRWPCTSNTTQAPRTRRTGPPALRAPRTHACIVQNRTPPVLNTMPARMRTAAPTALSKKTGTPRKRRRQNRQIREDEKRKKREGNRRREKNTQQVERQ